MKPIKPAETKKQTPFRLDSAPPAKKKAAQKAAATPATKATAKDDGEEETPPPKARRGFALMSAEQRRRIASQGGRAARDLGVAHRFSSQEASEAGAKGGLAVSRNREHMAEIGRRGGQARLGVTRLEEG